MPVPMNKGEAIIRDSRITTQQGRMSEERLHTYTVGEIEEAMREFIGLGEYNDHDNYERRLFMSVFIAWLKKQEHQQ